MCSAVTKTVLIQKVVLGLNVLLSFFASVPALILGVTLLSASVVRAEILLDRQNAPFTVTEYAEYATDEMESIFDYSETADFYSLTKTLGLLPDGAIIVNSARGALVDEDALMAALDSGRLAAAGLDCFKVEPGGNPAMSRYDNVFMLPHIGSATKRTRDAMGFRALDNLDAFFAGKTPRDLLAP